MAVLHYFLPVLRCIRQIFSYHMLHPASIPLLLISSLFLKCFPLSCFPCLSAPHTHTHPFNGPLSGTTQVRRYQSRKVKPVWILLKQETASAQAHVSSRPNHSASASASASLFLASAGPYANLHIAPDK